MEQQTLVKEICPTTTQEWVKNGALLVDVREKEEVEVLAYDVPNLMVIPLSEFDLHYQQIPQDKEVVMVCRGGGRSLRAAGFLINNGYDPEKVVNMKHGIIRWVQKGFPTIGDVSTVIAPQASSGCCGSTSGKTSSSCCDDSPNSNGAACC